jgi:hypothetical protein
MLMPKRLAGILSAAPSVAPGSLRAFAMVVAVAATRWPLWAPFLTATLAWAVVALVGYGIARLAGTGGDESPRGDEPDR